MKDIFWDTLADMWVFIISVSPSLLISSVVCSTRHCAQAVLMLTTILISLGGFFALLIASTRYLGHPKVHFFFVLVGVAVFMIGMTEDPMLSDGHKGKDLGVSLYTRLGVYIFNLVLIALYKFARGWHERSQSNSLLADQDNV